MKKIRFGENEVFAQQIGKQIDLTRFAVEFGPFDSLDFDKIDCIVPFRIREYRAFEKNKAFEGRKFWSTDPAVIHLCDDKLALNRSLLAGKFAEVVPELLENGSGRFPYIVKKRHDQNGVNSRVVRNLEEERAISRKLHSADYFCQTYISGSEEFALHILVAHRQLVYAQTVKYFMGRNFYVKGKGVPVVRQVFLPESDHLETFLALLSSLGFTGTCCINYKLDGDTPKLLEINPRFGFSLCWDINRYLDAYLGSLAANRQGIAAKAALA